MFDIIVSQKKEVDHKLYKYDLNYVLKMWGKGYRETGKY